MPEIKFSDNPNEETAFVTQDDGTRSRAVLTAAVEGDIEFPNNPNSTKVMVTVDGVKRRAVAVANVAGGGGGGSDPHNKGWFATQAALEAAYATAEDGDWAIVGATDTVWVWDSDSTSWKDTGSKAGYLPLSGGTMTGPIVLGNGAHITPASKFGASIGTDNAPFGSIYIQALRYGQLDGQDTGYFSVPYVFDTPAGGSLLGGIFRFPAPSFWYEQVIFQCLETNGDFVFGHFYTCVPDEQDPTVYKWVEVETQSRTQVNTTATLAAADWSSNTQIVNVTGMTADGVVFVNPTPANQSAYTDAGILCTAQAAGSLTFTCDTVPSADITVTVVML